MVAPVLDNRKVAVRLYLPMGDWVHLWSQQEINVNGPTGSWFNCDAPIGAPPVFFLSSSAPGRKLVRDLAVSGDGTMDATAKLSKFPCQLIGGSPKSSDKDSLQRSRSWFH